MTSNGVSRNNVTGQKMFLVELLIHFCVQNAGCSRFIQNPSLATRVIFDTNVGFPQDDSLSPLLFIVYLEVALKSVRQEIDNEVQEMVYADGIDFISSQNLDIGKIKSLEEWQLKLNCAKTETTKISLDDNEWKKTLKFGIKLGSKEDIKRRKALAICAMNKLSKI